VSKSKKKQMPEQLYVYLSDILNDGTKVYGAAQDLGEVRDDADIVGVYELVREAKLVITRGLK
jgi:hypothetical protein